MKTKRGYLLVALAVGALTPPIDADTADKVYVDADDVTWTTPPEDYSGAAFAEAFRYRTLIGGKRAPVQGENVFFGEAQFAPGAIYVGHNHPSPEIYYIVSGRALWTVDGITFEATPGTAIYAEPYAVHRMVNIGEGVLETVWMWWGPPDVTGHFPKRVEPIEQQPSGAIFTN